MFYLSWGSQTVQRVFGSPVPVDCPICHERRNFRKVITYRVRHVMQLARWITERSYVLRCEVCRYAASISGADAEAGEKSPIRFIDRHGWKMGLGVLVLAAGGLAAAMAWEDNLYLGRLQHPAVGDVYEVDLARLVVKPQADGMYGALLVTQVSPGSVAVRMPNSYFKDPNGVLNDISTGKARQRSSYTDEVETIPVAALPQMRKDGVILSVDR